CLSFKLCLSTSTGKLTAHFGANMSKGLIYKAGPGKTATGSHCQGLLSERTGLRRQIPLGLSDHLVDSFRIDSTEWRACHRGGKVNGPALKRSEERRGGKGA